MWSGNGPHSTSFQFSHTERKVYPLWIEVIFFHDKSTEGKNILSFENLHFCLYSFYFELKQVDLKIRASNIQIKRKFKLIMVYKFDLWRSRFQVA